MAAQEEPEEVEGNAVSKDLAIGRTEPEGNRQRREPELARLVSIFPAQQSQCVCRCGRFRKAKVEKCAAMAAGWSGQRNWSHSPPLAQRMVCPPWAAELESRTCADSEGLLLLSDEAGLNERLLHPARGHRRVYWAQVEGIPTVGALAQLQRGVSIQGRATLPCRARLLEPQPVVPPRDPPIRFRKNVSDCWIALDLVEGRNRQVRRMTAAIGHATLRLIRRQIGRFEVGDFKPGEWRILDELQRRRVLQS